MKKTFLFFILWAGFITPRDLFAQKITAKHLVNEFSKTAEPSEEDKEYYNFSLPKTGKYVVAKTKNEHREMLGINDSSGKTILPQIFSGIKKSGNYFIAKRYNTFCLYDSGFKLLLPAEFEYLEKTNVGDFFIIKNKYLHPGKFALIDKTGNFILPPKYKSIRKLYLNYKENNSYKKTDKFILVKDGANTAFYNTESKKFETDFIYTDIELKDWCFKTQFNDKKKQLLDFTLKPVAADTLDEIIDVGESGSFVIKKKQTMGVISYGGKYILAMKYTSIFVMDYGGQSFYVTEHDGLYQLTDGTGKLLKTYGSYQLIRLMKNRKGLFAKKNNEVGILSCWEEKIVPFKYDTILQLDQLYFCRNADTFDIYSFGGKFIKNIICDTVIHLVYNFYEVSRNNKIGIIDEELNEVIPVNFDTIAFLYLEREAHFLLKKENQYGLVTTKNEIVLPIEYELISGINNDNLILKQNGKYGLYSISKKKIILNCVFDMISMKATPLTR